MQSGQGRVGPGVQSARVQVVRPAESAHDPFEQTLLSEGTGPADGRSDEPHDTVDLAPARDALEDTLASAISSGPRAAPPKLPACIENLGRVFADGGVLRTRNYRIERRIGKGGFAEVYSAVDEGTGGRWALKVLNVLQASEPVSVERFKREGRFLEHLRGQSGFPKFREMFDEPGVGVVVVMELLAGDTLRARMERERITVHEALAIIKDIARTVALLHRKEIVHRDLKPENIILEPPPGSPADLDLVPLASKHAVVLDLGIAKTKGGPVTTSSSLVGTWQYVSPEHLGRGEISAASDVYALGCILAEIIEREHLYAYLERKGRTGAEAAYHVLYPVKLPERIPVSLWNRVVCPALEKNPKNRFPTALDFASAIESWQQDHEAGRLSRDDYEAACDAGDKAKPPPPPLPRETGRVPDRSPAEIPREEKTDSPSLLVLAPPEIAGRRYAIGRTLTIGRLLPTEDPSLAEADLTFPIDTLSGKHCRLEIADEEAARFVYVVRDWKSRNGTCIDGVPVTDGYLRPSQALRLGELELLFVEPGGPPSSLVVPKPRPPMQLDTPSPARPRTRRDADALAVTSMGSPPVAAAAPTSALVWVVGLVVVTCAVCITALVIAFRSPWSTTHPSTTSTPRTDVVPLRGDGTARASGEIVSTSPASNASLGPAPQDSRPSAAPVTASAPLPTPARPLVQTSVQIPPTSAPPVTAIPEAPGAVPAPAPPPTGGSWAPAWKR